MFMTLVENLLFNKTCSGLFALGATLLPPPREDIYYEPLRDMFASYKKLKNTVFSNYKKIKNN